MNQLSAIDTLCQGTMRAAIIILRDMRGAEFDDALIDKLSASLQATIKAEINKVMAEWKDALDANLSEGWLRALMDAQCKQLALQAINAMEAGHEIL